MQMLYSASISKNLQFSSSKGFIPLSLSSLIKNNPIYFSLSLNIQYRLLFVCGVTVFIGGVTSSLLSLNDVGDCLNWIGTADVPLLQ